MTRGTRDSPRPGAASWRPVRRATRSVDAFRHYSEPSHGFARGGARGAAEAEKRLDERSASAQSSVTPITSGAGFL